MLMAQVATVMPDGWVVTEPRAFRVLVGHAPPRPWGYWDQIRSDWREPKVVWIWARGLLFTAAGLWLAAVALATGEWSLLLVGALAFYYGLRLLLVWVRLAHSVVHSIRSHPTATGVVTGFGPHPVVPTLARIGRATRPSGEPVDVGAVVPLARAIESAGTPAEVWFLDAPDWQYRSVFAGRPQTPNQARQ